MPISGGLPDPSRPEAGSGSYLTRLQAQWYGALAPLYDVMLMWALRPFGGKRAFRRWLIPLLGVQPGDRVLSLCCGTGGLEVLLAAEHPDAEIVALDLGRGQIAVARRKDQRHKVEFRVGNAADPGYPDESFDRVLITLALHEMPRDTRAAVLREARRLCRQPGGVVIATEHAAIDSRWDRWLRFVFWFEWFPWNPEIETSRDLQRRGLAHEMRAAGLEPVRRAQARPPWIECVIARPAAACQ